MNIATPLTPRQTIYLPLSLCASPTHLVSRLPMSESSGKYTTTCDQVWESLDVFDPVSLRTEEDIKRAVNMLQNSLDDRSIGAIIQFSLHTHNCALEFILSCMSVLFLPVSTTN